MRVYWLGQRVVSYLFFLLLLSLLGALTLLCRLTQFTHFFSYLGQGKPLIK